jgi:hypothetical protein
MLEALVGGERDPEALAEYAQKSMRSKIPELVEALTGRFGEHQAFMVRVHLDQIDHYTSAITAYTERIEMAVAPFRAAREALITIPGVSILVADVIIAETGADMNIFPTSAHLASWAGVCPGSNESAGHIKSTLKRLLDANGQSFEIAQDAILSNKARIPTVAEVVQEHIDLLIRPSSGTVRTYQVMLDRHVRDVIGHIPVDKLDYRHLNHWVKSMMAKGKAPKTIHNVHGLISAAMNTAEMLQYIPKNPCRGVQLPSIDKAEDD